MDSLKFTPEELIEMAAILEDEKGRPDALSALALVARRIGARLLRAIAEEREVGT